MTPVWHRRPRLCAFVDLGVLRGQPLSPQPPDHPIEITSAKIPTQAKTGLEWATRHPRLATAWATRRPDPPNGSVLDEKFPLLRGPDVLVDLVAGESPTGTADFFFHKDSFPRFGQVI